MALAGWASTLLVVQQLEELSGVYGPRDMLSSALLAAVIALLDFIGENPLPGSENAEARERAAALGRRVAFSGRHAAQFPLALRLDLALRTADYQVSGGV